MLTPCAAARAEAAAAGKRPSVENVIARPGAAPLATKPSAPEVAADSSTSSNQPTKALNLCVASKKAPHLIMREVQRAFAEYKVGPKPHTRRCTVHLAGM
jgi:hypothetical protein